MRARIVQFESSRSFLGHAEFNAIPRVGETITGFYGVGIYTARDFLDVISVIHNAEAREVTLVVKKNALLSQ